MNFTGQPQAGVLGSNSGKKRGCQGASAYQLRGKGPDMPNRKGGWSGERWKNAHPSPSPRIFHLKRHKQGQAQHPVAPRRTLPLRGAQPQAPEAAAGSLWRSPRSRHTKSQNGCPKEARTTQLGRAGEHASAGKGEGDPRKSRPQSCGPDHRPPRRTGRFL